LEERAANGEGERIFQELERIDPESAGNIDSRNTRRVIRALEVTMAASIPYSQLQKKEPPLFNSLIIGLTADRTELYRRIDNRVDQMIEAGLIQETKGLLDMGYRIDLPSMSGIGYRQIGMYLQDSMSLESAVYQIKTETHRLVRRQYNWFKLDDKRIQWFDIIQNNYTEISKIVEAHLAG
jgi:tRNA dimethylallyltransferase